MLEHILVPRHRDDLLQRVLSLEHQRQEILGDQVRSLDVDLPHGPPLLWVTFRDHGHVGEAGVVYNHIESAYDPLCLRSSARNGLWISDIQLQLQDSRLRATGFQGGFLDYVRSGFERRAGAEDDVRGAGFGEAGCCCGAYDPACSCDEDCFAGEVLLGGVDGGIGGVVDGCSDGEVAC